MTTIQSLEIEAQRMLREMEALSQKLDDARLRDARSADGSMEKAGRKPTGGAAEPQPQARMHDATETDPPPFSAESTALCPVSWLLPELIELVAERPAEPVSSLEAAIHRRVFEQQFIDETGDPPLDQPYASGAEHQVRMLVAVLEKIRRQAIARGIWCDHPAVDPMCG